MDVSSPVKRRMKTSNTEEHDEMLRYLNRFKLRKKQIPYKPRTFANMQGLNSLRSQNSVDVEPKKAIISDRVKARLNCNLNALLENQSIAGMKRQRPPESYINMERNKRMFNRKEPEPKKARCETQGQSIPAESQVGAAGHSEEFRLEDDEEEPLGQNAEAVFQENFFSHRQSPSTQERRISFDSNEQFSFNAFENINRNNDITPTPRKTPNRKEEFQFLKTPSHHSTPKSMRSFRSITRFAKDSENRMPPKKNYMDTPRHSHGALRTEKSSKKLRNHKVPFSALKSVKRFESRSHEPKLQDEEFTFDFESNWDVNDSKEPNIVDNTPFVLKTPQSGDSFTFNTIDGSIRAGFGDIPPTISQIPDKVFFDRPIEPMKSSSESISFESNVSQSRAPSSVRQSFRFDRDSMKKTIDKHQNHKSIQVQISKFKKMMQPTLTRSRVLRISNGNQSPFFEQIIYQKFQTSSEANTPGD